MKISIAQFAPVFGDKTQNSEKILDYIDKIDSDIIVLPELALTGYFFLSGDESAAYAESFSDGKFCSSLQEASSRSGKIIICGFPELSAQKEAQSAIRAYNSAAIIFPESQLSRVYRKTHLFYKERNCFLPGDSGFFVVRDEKRDISIGIMICYDWRFPEAARTLALMGADLIVCPSNLVTNLWHKVMPARAIENKVYFAVANRCGSEKRGDEELTFKGESAIYDYNGKTLAKAGMDEEIVITAEINPTLARNKSFNPLDNIFLDRRPEMYQL